MTSGSHLAIHRSRFVDFEQPNITALVFSHGSNIEKVTPTDLRLALGKSNGDIEIWNPRFNWFQEFHIPGGSGRSIEGLCWCNVPGEPLRIFSIGGSTTVTEWDLASGLPLKNYDCNAGVIWSIAINKSQNKLAVGCDNGTIVIIDISGGPGSLEHDTILVRQEAKILSLAWKDDRFVVGGCSDGKIRIWSAEVATEDRGRILQTMKVDKSKKESTLVWAVLYLPNTDQIVSGDSTGSVKFWDFHFATLTHSFKAHNADILCLTTDFLNKNVYSAGVDRKIFQISQITTKTKKNKTYNWAISANRLFHGNDVRAMCCYQAKGSDLLISGGLEKTLVISGLSSFTEGNYRKIPLGTSFTQNVIVNEEQRLVVSWHESIVKIWSVGHQLDSPNNYKLVCKLKLKDSQNITTCALSKDGQVLVVGRASSTKLFHLFPINNDNKLKVTKLDNDFLLDTGTKVANFIDNSQLLVCTPKDVIYYLDLEADNDEDAMEIELEAIADTKNSRKIVYLNTVKYFEVNVTTAVVARHSGAIDIIDLVNKTSKPLVRLTQPITALSINKERKTAILATANNKIYEFHISEEEYGLRTSWCIQNSDNLPKELQTLKDKCTGIFCDKSNTDRIWFWGSTWICRIDFSVNFPVSNRRKPKKHSRDGLTIDEDEQNEVDDDLDENESNLEPSESLEISEPRTIKGKQSDIKLTKDSFFITEKYRPIIYANMLSSNELIIIEKPQSFAASKGAFNLSKLIF